MSEPVNGVNGVGDKSSQYKAKPSDNSPDLPDNSVFKAAQKIYDKAVANVDAKHPDPNAVTQKDVQNLYNLALTECDDPKVTADKDGKTEINCSDGAEISYYKTDTDTKFDYQMGGSTLNIEAAPHSQGIALQSNKYGNQGIMESYEVKNGHAFSVSMKVMPLDLDKK